MKNNFLNKQLCHNWWKHKEYFDYVSKLEKPWYLGKRYVDLPQESEVKKETAMIGVKGERLYILSIKLTPYFYLNKKERDSDYKSVISLL